MVDDRRIAKLEDALEQLEILMSHYPDLNTLEMLDDDDMTGTRLCVASGSFTIGDIRIARKVLDAAKQIEEIANGTKIQTVKQAVEAEDWTQEALASRKWGVTGTVIAHSDSHGLYYEVRHDDGTIGWYEPQELELLNAAK